MKISSGHIRLFGTELNHFKDFNKIGYVSQHAVQFDPLFPATVEEIVRLGCLSKEEAGEKANGGGQERGHRGDGAGRDHGYPEEEDQ